MFNPSSIDRAFQRFLSAVDPAPTEPEKQESASPVTAKMDMTSPEVCPYCKTPMVITQCCGQSMYVCHDDRAVFPLEDSPKGG